LQLAHQERNEISAAYNHAQYLKQRTEMMQFWGDYIEGLTKADYAIVGKIARAA